MQCVAMRSAAQLIERLGGSDAFARAIGAHPVTVRSWKHRNSIPRAAWPELQVAFPETATLEALLETEHAAPLGERRSPTA